jgi:hypothetical protein
VVVARWKQRNRMEAQRAKGTIARGRSRGT